jgi:hypothetical protein
MARRWGFGGAIGTGSASFLRDAMTTQVALNVEWRNIRCSTRPSVLREVEEIMVGFKTAANRAVPGFTYRRMLAAAAVVAPHPGTMMGPDRDDNGTLSGNDGWHPQGDAGFHCMVRPGSNCDNGNFSR